MHELAEFGNRIDGFKYKDREAVYGLLFMNEKVAIVETPKGCFLPVGGVEENETHEECLIREMKEEIGIEVKLNEYIGKSVLYYMSPENKICYNLYGCFYTVDEVKRVVKSEDDHELVWMDLDEAISRLKLTHQVWAIEKVVENRC